MQTYMTSTEKTHSVSRPDPTDRARGPADSGQADANGTQFSKIFHAASRRSGEVETDGSAGARGASANAPDGRGRDGTEQSGGATEDPKDPATEAEPGRAGTAEADATGAGHKAEPDATSPQIVADSGQPGDVTDPDALPRTVPDRAETTRSDASGPSLQGQAVAQARDAPTLAVSMEGAGKRPAHGTIHGTIPPEAGHPGRAGTGDRKPERLPADAAAQSRVASASITSDRAGGSALPDPLDLARSVEGARPGRTAETDAWRAPMTRGRQEAHPSVPNAAPALANTVSPPVMHGQGPESLASRRDLSALFAESAGTDGAGRGRDLDMPLGAEPRGTAGSNPGSATFATLPRADLPQNIAMQIAAAIQKGGPGMKPGIELRLSPEELGAVRLTFVQSETGVTVNVHADRAETLELLRRNIDTLAQEFLDIGYDSAEFTFGGRDPDAQNAGRTAALTGPATEGETTPDAHRALTPTLLISDRLDIRL
jgi:hypothetical protein